MILSKASWSIKVIDQFNRDPMFLKFLFPTLQQNLVVIG